MNTSARTRALGFILVGGALFAARPAAAQGEQVANAALNDTFLLLFNGPVYLSSRLPMLLASQPPGAGMELESPGDFSLGMSLKSDVYSQFADVAYGTDMLGFEEQMPDVVPLPAVGLHARVGLSHDWDAGVRVDLFPEMDRSIQGTSIAGGHWVVGANTRYRLVRARGLVPELLIGVGASGAKGGMTLSRSDAEQFNRPVSDGEGSMEVGGTYDFSAGPKLEWTLYQVQTEVRTRWRWSFFNPYVGMGVDLTGGSIRSSLDGTLTVTMDSVNGQPVPPELETRTGSDMVATLADEKPSPVIVHPVAGFEIAMGPFALAVQADVSLPLAHRATAQSDEVEEFLGNDEGFYYVRYRNDDSGFRNPAFAGSVGMRYDFK